MIAIIAMSGVPPLTGFGGKWMLFNAMMDKGWYWLAALAFFSSAVAFLYMYRFLHAVFLGQRKSEHRELREAPWILLAPQFVMAALIMVLSVYPKLLLDPLSSAISPWMAGALTWDGLALTTHLGYWNAPMIMGVVAGVWMVPLIILLLASLTIKIQKVEQFNIVYAAERPERPETTHFAYNFFAHYDRALGFLVRPRATVFWSNINEWSHTMASSLRIIYTGNGQTYALFVLMYFVAMYLVNGGLTQ
jgi:NADH:ubiquinone oxidoreductase subunit 5 (subunit L)/multisubunit Na+/H+ antiporter MnhA subunit